MNTTNPGNLYGMPTDGDADTARAWARINATATTTITTTATGDVHAWAEAAGLTAYTVHHTTDCDIASTGDECIGGCEVTGEVAR